ncbi:MAG: hypothetical protein M1817_002440 [Caeruleum heppii]|nr:MAG: hypothetical protein M1817_002440 [Caeruleum heppii]
MAQIPPEELQYQLANINDDRSPILIAVNFTGFALATIAVGLRLLARRVSGLPLKADDYTILVSLVLVLALFIIFSVLIFYGGSGKHAIVVGEARIIAGLQALYAFSLVYANVIMLIKISILLLYNRIFAIPKFRKWINACIGLFIAIQVSTAFVTMLNCIPIRAAWDKTIPNARCLDPRTIYKGVAATSIVTDAIVLVIPLPLIWRLRIHTHQKTALSFIFGIASLTCVATIFRFTVFDDVNMWDTTWSYTDIGLWTIAEVYLGMICACLPTLKPVALRFTRTVAGSSLWSKLTTSASSSHGKSRTGPGSQSYPPGSISRPAMVSEPRTTDAFARPEAPWRMRTEARHEKLSDGEFDDGVPLHGIRVKNDVEWARGSKV